MLRLTSNKVQVEQGVLKIVSTWRPIRFLCSDLLVCMKDQSFNGNGKIFALEKIENISPSFAQIGFIYFDGGAPL